MIDRIARDKIAEALRHYVSGQITNEELFDQLPSSSLDKGVIEIAAAIQYEYDFGPERFDSKRRHDDLLRIILFLQNDLEYVYPSAAWSVIIAIVTAGLALGYWESTFNRLVHFISPYISAITATILLPLASFYTFLWMTNKLMKVLSCTKYRMKPVDKSVWPFKSLSDFQKALENPKLLRGESPKGSC